MLFLLQAVHCPASLEQWLGKLALSAFSPINREQLLVQKVTSVQMPGCFRFSFWGADYSDGSSKASPVSCGIAEIPQVPFCQDFKL